MRETSLHISRWIVRHYRIMCSALLLCSLSYCPAHAQPCQPPTGPKSDNNLEQTLELLATTLVVTVIVVIVFMFTVHCSNGTAGTNQWRLPGLEKAVIEAFPVLVYSAVKQIKIGQESSLECAICLGEFEDDETLRLLLPKCNHVFHPACIDMWLASHVTCPVCRANLRPESAANFTKHPTQQQAAREPNQHNSSALAQCNATLDDDIVITIDEEQNRDSQVTVMASASQQRFFPPPRPAIPEKFPRSHSTGHSLEEYTERYTLRLPEDVMRQLISRTKLARMRSFKVCTTREWSSSRGYKEDGGGGGGEDSSRGRQIGIGRSDVWVFSMTPPFVSRGGSVKS